MSQVKKFSLICILLLLTGVAGSFGLANIYFKQAEVRVKSWQFFGRISNEQEYQQALAYANDALLYHPGHNQYLEIKAQILEWGADDGFEISRSNALQSAKELYLQSSKTRPTWPGTWAALAMLKWRMQEFDMEMIRYLQNAFIVGKHSPEVVLAYSQLGAVIKDYHPQLFSHIVNQYQYINQNN